MGLAQHKSQRGRDEGVGGVRKRARGADDVVGAAKIGEGDKERGFLPRKAQGAHDGGFIGRRIAGGGHLGEASLEPSLRIAGEAAREARAIAAGEAPQERRMIGERFEQGRHAGLAGEGPKLRRVVGGEQLADARTRLIRIGEARGLAQAPVERQEICRSGGFPRRRRRFFITPPPQAAAEAAAPPRV